MIASKGSTEWVIETASRCGSSRLRTALTQEAEKRPQNPVAEFLNPWQGGEKEDVEGYDLRIFIAREPIERWNSLYWYFKNVREDPPLESYLDDFAHFMEGILARNWTHYDCTPLTDHLKAFEPDRVVLVSQIDLIWDWIDAPYFWKDYYYNKSSSHANSGKLPVDETLDRSDPLSDQAEALMEEEKQMLKDLGAYDHPDPSPPAPVSDTSETASDLSFEVKSVPTTELTPHPENYKEHPPQQIAEIKSSIRQFGFYKNIVVARDLTILAGHGVVLAADEMHEIEEVPVVIVDLDPQSPQAKKILVGDNEMHGLATNDEEQLAQLAANIHEEDTEQGLSGTGLTEEMMSNLVDEHMDPTTPDGDGEDGYTSKIDTPTYEPTGEEPPVEDLFDNEKTERLLEQISEHDLPPEVMEFLRLAAHRHTRFDFEKIAEFYAHADPEVQKLMEQSALVIIDFEDAIEQGFVSLTQSMQEITEADENAQG